MAVPGIAPMSQTNPFPAAAVMLRCYHTACSTYLAVLLGGGGLGRGHSRALAWRAHRVGRTPNHRLPQRSAGLIVHARRLAMPCSLRYATEGGRRALSRGAAGRGVQAMHHTAKWLNTHHHGLKEKTSPSRHRSSLGYLTPRTHKLSLYARAKNVGKAFEKWWLSQWRWEPNDFTKSELDPPISP